MMVLLTLTLLFSSCGEKPSDPTPESADSTSAVTDVPTDAITEVPTEAPAPQVTEETSETPVVAPDTTTSEIQKEEPIVFDTLTDLGKMITPFWKLNVMYNESTTFIVREDGSITAKLYFKPTKIISVLSNDLKTTFTEGKDYTWDGESNTLTLTNNSAIPYFTQNDLHGKDENGQYIPDFGSATPWDALGRSRFGDQLYCVSAFLYEKQIAVTYEYEFGAWDGPTTEYQGDHLPKTMEKLKNNETINVVFFGDSIFTGCDSSKMHAHDPMQDSFPTLIKNAFEETYPQLHVKCYNPSVGGKDSVWGVENVQLVIDKQPDLVFIGFGMNDGTRSGRAVIENLQKIIDAVREKNPDCEFVVVAPMVPNQAAGFLQSQGQYPRAFSKLAGEGVAYVDMFNCHSKLLEQKDFVSMSGNNINHPNDWLIRVYAMNLWSALHASE